MTYLITGGTGYFAKKYISYLLKNDLADKIIVFSRDEYKQSKMREEFGDEKIRYFLGDVRDLNRLRGAIKGADAVLHTAALKRIEFCSYNPYEAHMTNVVGTENVARACIDANVKRAVFLSTDKAVDPINLYGATKCLAEKLWLDSNYYKPIFNVVRYGNVISSRGSVIELFKTFLADNILEAPITHPDMTRFAMSYNDAISLVHDALTFSRIGVIITKACKSYNILQLARVLGFKSHRIIGMRQDEKLHETLINHYERDRCELLENGHIVIHPSETYKAYPDYEKYHVEHYRSDHKLLTDKELLERI